MKSKIAYPEWPNHIGKKGQAKDPAGAISKYTIVDEVSIPQSDAPDKLIYLQKIEHENRKLNCAFVITSLASCPK